MRKTVLAQPIVAKHIPPRSVSETARTDKRLVRESGAMAEEVEEDAGYGEIAEEDEDGIGEIGPFPGSGATSSGSTVPEF